MNQATLNLIAISIFVMTFSALLSPFLQISPFVPAIATLTVLGIATLDSFSWQGRGMNLLLDGFASFSPTHRERVTHHEAGHFLAAQQLQIPVTGYTLSAWETLNQGLPGTGGVQFDLQELESELQQGKLSAQLLDRYCIVWLAGAAAEMMVYGTVEGGADDRQKLRAVLTKLGYPDSQVEQKERWAALQAKAILQENQLAFEALVAAMTQRLPVTDCHALVERHLKAEVLP
jgi:hypothetical protein